MIAPRALALAALSLLVGCGGPPPLRTVPSVDLARFAGDWYVIAHLPLRAEREAYDAVEHYDVVDESHIAVRFTFREGAFDGEPRTLRMRAWVHDRRTRAEWRVRPFWPIAFDYCVVHLDPEYHVTVIGHPSRDYVWIMARTPTLDETTLASLRAELEAQGYDLRNLRMVPQSPR